MDISDTPLFRIWRHRYRLEKYNLATLIALSWLTASGSIGVRVCIEYMTESSFVPDCNQFSNKDGCTFYRFRSNDSGEKELTTWKTLIGLVSIV